MGIWSSFYNAVKHAWQVVTGPRVKPMPSQAEMEAEHDAWKVERKRQMENEAKARNGTGE